MIYNTNQIYGKVWKATTSDTGKYIDLQITTSEKDSEGNYKNSSWFPRAIGHAANSLKKVQKGDKIVITKSKFTNERYEDENGDKKSRFRFLILEASISDESEPSAQKPPAKKQTPAAAQDDDCPW